MDTIIKQMEVFYNDRIVGFLEMLPDDRVAFQYSTTWVREGFSISPFYLPLTDEVFISSSPYFKGLFGVFNDSLPDGWGEYLLRRMLLKRNINFDKLSPLNRLSLVNETGLGGLKYRPTQKNENNNKIINLDLLAKSINEELNDRSNDLNLDELFRLGGASGGARPKAHLKIDNEMWIIKFPALNESYDVGIEEYETNLLAKKCGINVANFKLFDSSISKGFFGSKRFDRNGYKDVHVISLAAILETTHKISNLDYIHLFQVIDKISVVKEDLYEAFKRMTFNVLYGNKDDHSKNHSFYYDEKLKGYCLTPAYDITKTSLKLEHEMTVNGNGNPTVDDLMKVQELMGLNQLRCRDIIKKISQIVKK